MERRDGERPSPPPSLSRRLFFSLFLAVHMEHRRHPFFPRHKRTVEWVLGNNRRYPGSVFNGVGSLFKQCSIQRHVEEQQILWLYFGVLMRISIKRFVQCHDRCERDSRLPKELKKRKKSNVMYHEVVSHECYMQPQDGLSFSGQLPFSSVRRAHSNRPQASSLRPRTWS